jgi:hypothetical protein
VKSVKRSSRKIALAGSGLVVVFLLLTITTVRPNTASAQHPTLSIPTVTGTPAGPLAHVWQNLKTIPVRAGPGQNYPEVGLLVAGQKIPALGSSPGGEWVQIVYPGVPGNVGWVYGVFVGVSGPLDVVPIPASPTPRVTPTLNPTLAFQLPAGPAPTRLPTFTIAPPIAAPTYEVDEPSFIARRNIPMGFIIIGFAVIGLFGTALSFLRGR